MTVGKERRSKSHFKTSVEILCFVTKRKLLKQSTIYLINSKQTRKIQFEQVATKVLGFGFQAPISWVLGPWPLNNFAQITGLSDGSFTLLISSSNSPWARKYWQSKAKKGPATFFFEIKINFINQIQDIWSFFIMMLCEVNL